MKKTDDEHFEELYGDYFRMTPEERDKKFKKTCFIALAIIAFVALLIAYNCTGDSEDSITQNKLSSADIEERIYTTLTRQAKSILNHPSTYDFEKMDDYRVNDSLRVYAHRFSGANAFNVREHKYAIGYFNINTGQEVDRTMLEFYASPEELKSVAAIVNPR